MLSGLNVISQVMGHSENPVYTDIVQNHLGAECKGDES